MMLKYESFDAQPCSHTGCTSQATHRCKSCIKPTIFCNEHGKVHWADLSHSLVDASGNYLYMGSSKTEMSPGPDFPSRLMLTVSGWYYETRKSKKDIDLEGIWFPCSPSRPAAFIHLEMMNLGFTMLSSGKLSLESIMGIFERMYASPPPPMWKNKFSEALKQYSSFTNSVKI